MADKVSELATCVGIALHDLKQTIPQNKGGRFLGFLDYTYDPDNGIGTLTAAANAGDYYIVRVSGSGYGSAGEDFFANGVSARQALWHQYDETGHLVTIERISSSFGGWVQTGDKWVCLADNTPASTESTYAEVRENWIVLHDAFRFDYVS